MGKVDAASVRPGRADAALLVDYLEGAFVPTAWRLRVRETGRQERVRRITAALATIVFSAATFPATAAMSWSFPQALNTTAATDGSRSDYSPCLATDGAGTWVAVWNSRNLAGGPFGDDMDIFFACSADDGDTWTAPAAVDPAATTDDLHDSEAVVYTDGTGRWLIAWGQWDQAADSVHRPALRRQQ